LELINRNQFIVILYLDVVLLIKPNMSNISQNNERT